jgi:hypothetical protein
VKKEEQKLAELQRTNQALLEEMAEACTRYLEARKQLSQTLYGSSESGELEAAIYTAVSTLKIRSALALASLDKQDELAEKLEAALADT